MVASQQYDNKPEGIKVPGTGDPNPASHPAKQSRPSEDDDEMANPRRKAGKDADANRSDKNARPQRRHGGKDSRR